MKQAVLLIFLILQGFQGNCQDSIVFNPGEGIKQGFFRNLFLGKGYRDVWKTSVKAPVLDIEALGLRPDKVGGRMETQSLRFYDAQGRAFVGRSVNKDLSRMLAEKKQKGMMGRMLRDHASANEPYAALVVAELAKKINIIHPTPTLYVLPNDSTLGPFTKDYKGMPVLFEERPNKTWKGEHVFGSPSKIIDTEKLIKKRFEEAEIEVDKEMYLKGRLLDMLVGDWSRHDEQYKWALVPKDSGFKAFPIPKDRDHAFYKKQGLLNKLSLIVWPYSRNFTHSISKVDLLNHMAGNMDRLILPGVSKDEWFRITREFLAVVDTNAIMRAVKKLPSETYAIDGKELETKMRSRLKELPVASEKFYRSVNQTPFIPATDKKDKIEVSMFTDSVVVKLSRKDYVEPYFFRTFFYPETGRITIAAMDGEDKLIMKGTGSKIMVNVLQGPSEDEVIAKDILSIENLAIYDTKPRKIYDYLTSGIKNESRRKKRPEVKTE